MIYLDNAATSLQKPSTVPQAVANAIRTVGSPGRGGHRPGMRAGDVLYRCREKAADLFRVKSPEQVVLTMNATHGLNIAIRSLVREGSTVLISGYEHNSVTRVLRGIRNVDVKVAAGSLFDQEDVYRAFERQLTDDVSAVICNHVSNVFGFIQPVDRIAELCRKRKKPLIVDASQSAGILPVDAERWGAEFIAMPGHKGLMGPQGTGLLLCTGDAAPLLYGGTGGNSVQQAMPEYLPDRLEAGTPNVCGAAGLLAGLKFVEELGADRIRRHECALAAEMMNRLEQIRGVTVYRGERDQIGLFSFCAEGIDCEELGEQLGRKGVAVRAGLHCAPLAHQTAGTLEKGTVRVSFSPFNTPRQADVATAQIRSIVVGERAR